MMRTEKGIVCEAKPILISEVIHQHLVKQVPLQERVTSKRPKVDVEDHITSTVEEFKKITQEVFGDHLAFAFVFGSVAKNQQTFSLSKRSDLDTFVCLKDDVSQKMKDEYIKRIISLQKLKGFAYDAKYPAEIVTLKHLKDVVSNLDNVKPKLGEINPDTTYDAIIWTQVLNDAKRGFIGDGRLMSSLIKQTSGQLERWRLEIIGQLESGVKLADGTSVDIEKLRSAPIYSVLKRCLSYEDKGIGVKI